MITISIITMIKKKNIVFRHPVANKSVWVKVEECVFEVEYLYSFCYLLTVRTELMKWPNALKISNMDSWHAKKATDRCKCQSSENVAKLFENRNADE